MIHSGIQFHNISHTTSVPGCPGLSLHRVPDFVRAGLNEVAQGVGLCPSHAELRFVTTAPVSKLTLYSGGHHEYAFVYCGDFHVGEHCIEPNQALTIELNAASRPPALASGGCRRFPSHLWRVRLSGTNRVHFVDLNTAGHEVRPPLPGETPAVRWLAYGSSITQGFSASRLANPWTQLAAATMGYDLLNLGFGGSCHAESALADYIAARDDWDFCTLELGINLLNHTITLAEFRARVAYLLDRLHAGRPGGKVVVITPFLNRQDVVGLWDENAAHDIKDLRRILREEVSARSDRAHLRLLEGCEILPRADGLSSDLCHPSDFGHALMAANFTALLNL